MAASMLSAITVGGYLHAFVVVSKHIDAAAGFTVRTVGEKVRLQSVRDPSRFLCVKSLALTHGDGGRTCEFTIAPEGEYVVLRAEAGLVGFGQDGSALAVGDSAIGPAHLLEIAPMPDA